MEQAQNNSKNVCDTRIFPIKQYLHQNRCSRSFEMHHGPASKQAMMRNEQRHNRALKEALDEGHT